MEVKEVYCSFEIAKLLKEKGFDTSCLSTYDINNGKQYFSTSYIMCATRINAPTHQMAKDWLRKNYNLHVCPKLACFRGAKKYDKKYYKWEDRVLRLPTNNQVHPQLMGIHEYYNTYEEAVEAALKCSLENLI